jgi:hypothetical protein
MQGDTNILFALHIRFYFFYSFLLCAQALKTSDILCSFEARVFYLP